MTSKEALDSIIWRLTSQEEDLESRETTKKEIEIIKQDLDRLEKLEEVIEILRNKRVNIDLLLNSSEYPTYNFYAKKKQDLEDLTQQEYELLKEVFGE